MNSMQTGDADQWTLNVSTVMALFAILVCYPAWRMAVAYFDLFPGGDGRESWWALWTVILVGHWFVAAVCAGAITSEQGGWRSIGLDVRLFIRGRYLWLTIILVAAVAAYLAPQYLYGETTPERMMSHPLGPVSEAERIFWIAMAITAGVVEEIVYRGYALTRLKKILGAPAAIILSVAAFALMHGPSAFQLPFLALYVVSGLLFSGLFIAFGYRRLEWLILFHILLDIGLVAAP
ncbi:MAG: CPBP family intramembrane glutamic endopeptidase [Pseudomonadota bacterium]